MWNPLWSGVRRRSVQVGGWVEVAGAWAQADGGEGQQDARDQEHRAAADQDDPFLALGFGDDRLAREAAEQDHHGARGYGDERRQASHHEADHASHGARVAGRLAPALHGVQTGRVSAPGAIVVGGGIYGWGCAWRLAQLGAAVTVIDPRDTDDGERASGGVTRVLRLEYGAGAVYSELTLRAHAAWRQIEQATGEDLYREVGVLFLVPQGDEGAWEHSSLAVLDGLGVAGRQLDLGEIGRRWPSIRPEGIAWGVANPIGGFLWAQRATRVIARLGQAAGARYVRRRVIASDGAGVDLDDGAHLEADIVVLTTGAWSASLVPDIAIRPTRQVTAYLAGGPAEVPVFGEGAPFAMYGMPAHDGFGMKIGSHVTGRQADPDDPAERIATDEDLEPIRAYATRRFGMTGGDARIVRADVCFYAMTPTEDPVVDRLDDGRVLCAGFSGHGFKFAPVLAPAVAEFALGHEPSSDLRPFRR